MNKFQNSKSNIGTDYILLIFYHLKIVSYYVNLFALKKYS
ncbi:hypothetical protein SAMN05216324_11471 [Chryseobacterium limigenitum]|uniref:Uncharacterized protein n=1 Tax=Chryseobacterium limigenitum TaxID=1612149 RepID=A0A1K2IUM4_9FLAO|nr:hypothetical protein SAMN05216324_11471 [Chryseobacterium limigenitum]